MNTSAAQLIRDVNKRPSVAKPRFGFLGTGWIGRNRLQAIVDSGLADVHAIAEPSPEMASAALAIAPDAQLVDSYPDLLDQDLDGVVIATPSALHADQAIAALNRGFPVFCQKPLARNAEETRRVVEAAEAANSLLAVDLSYRYLDGANEIKRRIADGELGEIFAVDLVFHNAYGPDKTWFFDRSMSGGGCLIDLGIHLVDLAMWMLGFPAVSHVSGMLSAKGQKLSSRQNEVEDYASAQMALEPNIAVQLACSWNLNAGRDAVISASFYGTGGGACLRNIDGSFFDFTCERFAGTSTNALTGSAESKTWEWGGRAAIDWASRLAVSSAFDPAAYNLIDVAEVIDQIYASAD